MCNYFQEQTKDSVRQVIFSSLFSPQGNKADDSRMALLGKLVSMAVAVCRVPVLECAAFWLQVLLLWRQGCLGEGVRACSRVGTVNWGTAGHSQLLLPGSCSCPMSVLMSVPVLWHQGELCQSVHVLQWKKKLFG